jgi:hypothetical protein
MQGLAPVQVLSVQEEDAAMRLKIVGSHSGVCTCGVARVWERHVA